MKIICWDIETYYNIFSFTAYVEELNQYFVFEISDRKNQKQELIQFLDYAIKNNYYFVGFNNINFDYEVMHLLFTNPYSFNLDTITNKVKDIFSSQKSDRKFNIYYKDRYMNQIDLFKIHHFDNKARTTSLKSLQFAMRAESVEDLPFPIGNLTDEQKDILIQYNIHDVKETYRFYLKSKHLIELRLELQNSGMIYGDVLNFNDVKIGSEYLIKEIGRENCYTSYNQPIQTHIHSLALKDVILPNIQFHDDQFEDVKSQFEKLIWYKDTENEFAFERTIRGFTYHFGIGGIHGSVQWKKFESNEDYEIIDLDVTSLYPSIGIVNRFYPKHLGESFVDKYAGLKVKRLEHKKGTPLNAMFKLALNGAYGKSNDKYSPFYDPSYMLKITINGQLQLLMLAELLGSVPDLQIIQINTDGITCYVPKKNKEWFEFHQQCWQEDTGLELERAEYKKMWVRDVNNYLAVSTKGSIKSKGAYWYPETDMDYEGNWHKDHSAMVIQKAARLCLLEGLNPEVILRLYTDPYDFCLRYKTPNGSTAFIGDKECTKTVRYYVSTKGQSMFVRSKPTGTIGDYKRKNGLTDQEYLSVLNTIPKGQWDERIHTKNKSRYEMVERSIESGKLVKNCNNIKDFNFADIDYDYYIKEVEKLLCF